MPKGPVRNDDGFRKMKSKVAAKQSVMAAKASKGKKKEKKKTSSDPETIKRRMKSDS